MSSSGRCDNRNIATAPRHDDHIPHTPSPSPQILAHSLKGRASRRASLRLCLHHKLPKEHSHIAIVYSPTHPRCVPASVDATCLAVAEGADSQHTTSPTSYNTLVHYPYTQCGVGASPSKPSGRAVFWEHGGLDGVSAFHDRRVSNPYKAAVRAGDNAKPFPIGCRPFPREGPAV